MRLRSSRAFVASLAASVPFASLPAAAAVEPGQPDTPEALIEAMEKELGLTLEAARREIEVVVVRKREAEEDGKSEPATPGEVSSQTSGQPP